jgi:glutaredoxin
MRTFDRIAIAALTITLAAAAAPAVAQFKWVGPDGATNYSDQPPPVGIQATSMRAAAADRGADGDVPAGLRLATEKYPATLYTTAECAPCQQARAHLVRRGIPYTEKTVKTSADAEAFRRIGFAENSFPSLSVGRERSVGYEAGDWDRVLDIAGYPKTSALPPSFKQAPPQPMAGAPAPARTKGPSDAAGTTAGDSADATARAGGGRESMTLPMPTAQAPGTPPRGSVSVRF